MIKKIGILLMIITICLNSVAQKINPSCNFKKLGKLMTKVDGHSTKNDLDKLFGVDGFLSEDAGKSDSTVKVYTYKFCDDKIINTYFAAFLKGKIIYILKSFKSIEDCGKEEDFHKALNKNYAYKDIKTSFGVEGDLKMICWDPKTAMETQTEYIWRCCNSTTYYSVVFEGGTLKSCTRFPIKIDYSRPIKDKK